MCTVSNMGDDFRNRFPDQYPWWPTTPHRPNPNYPNPNPNVLPSMPLPIDPNQYASKEEVEKLRRELEALKEVLKAAKIYDEVTGQPDCEMDDKVKAIKTIADAMGVSMEDVFGKSNED